MRGLAAGALCLALAAGARAGEPAPGPSDAAPPTAQEVLQAAFDNFYACDTRAEVELSVRSRGGSERNRVLDVATKQIDGMRRGLARITRPAELRGMSFLMIENPDRAHDTFVYLPSQRRVRRISTAQKDDAFVGSDLSYEDMERRRPRDYDAALLPEERVEGEPAFAVEARPRLHDAYERVVLLVAQADSALLELRFFKSGSPESYRVMRMPRSAMHSEDGHVLPTRIEVENRRRGTTTVVTYRDLEVNPELEERLFVPSWLERDRDFRPAAVPAPR